MKCTLLTLVMLFCSSLLFAQDQAKCVYEFGVNEIPKDSIVGDLGIQGKSFSLDGTNRLMLPAGILGDGKDYTIEFELKTQNRRDINLNIMAMQDNDYDKGPFQMIVNKGFAFAFYGYGAGQLYMNESQNELGVNSGTCPLPWKGEGKYFKQTFVVKDSRLQYFIDGLIRMQTDAFTPPDADAVVRFGQLRGKEGSPEKLKTPLEVRNLKIYDGVVFPTGYDGSIEGRLSYTGPEYSLMREKIEDPTKKRVLIVGDSISMGYRGQITNHVKDKTYVDYWMGGTWFGPDVCKDGKESKPYIAWEGVAANGPYNVITFNPMTLHWWGLKHQGRCDVSYMADTLQKYLDFIRENMPKAKIIWINCTPIRTLNPDGTSTVDNEEDRHIREFNKIANEVIAKNNIPNVDLYSIALKHLAAVKKNSTDPVHWDKATSDDFATAIAVEVDKALAEKATKDITLHEAARD